MAKPTKDCEEILRAGASISIKSTKPPSDLAHLASVAKAHQVTLTLRNVTKPTKDLCDIARAGEGFVVMELAD